MGTSDRPPFMYQAVTRDDDRFPPTSFDPKAVTRASYESKKPKPKPNGPLVSAANRHPDAHMVPNGRSNFRTMSRRTKGWIKGMRVVQLCLRLLEVVAAIGLIVAMVLAGLMSGVFAWVMGVTLGVAILHCSYSTYHHCRPAGARTPGSSAAYHLFSALSDLCVPPLYAYGAFTTRNKWDELKTTDIANTNAVKYMVPSVHYGLIGAGGLHLLSLATSLWLGLMFRRIAKMPPDMNPLEANLTSRAHKRNKSSVATASTYYDEKPETQLYDNSSRPPSIPFMHTRQNSETSIRSGDSRLNLPSRQYQVTPSNRSSATSQDLKRMSAPPSSHRASYTEIPLGETGTSPSRPTSMYSGRPSTGTVPSYRAEPVSPSQITQPRSARFTETWYASDSLINRTQQRTRATHSPKKAASSPQRGTYASLDASDSDSDNENDNYYTPARGTEQNENHHPNPLGSHPPIPPVHNNNHPISTTSSPEKPSPRRPRTPFSRLRASKILADISLNDRRVSGGGQDITDQSQTLSVGKFQPRNRNSSIQPDSGFTVTSYSKPYGELREGTPPIMIGGGGAAAEDKYRQVSSGNDYYDLGVAGMGRRNVSGRAAEEGRVFGRAF